MPRPKPMPMLSDNESKILIAVYENPELSDTYSLLRILRPKFSAGTSEGATAFKETMIALEGLIVHGYIDGARLKGADGMYFNAIKLKYAGKQAAIQERNRIAGSEFSKIMAKSDAIIQEIIDNPGKTKS